MIHFRAVGRPARANIAFVVLEGPSVAEPDDGVGGLDHTTGIKAQASARNWRVFATFPPLSNELVARAPTSIFGARCGRPLVRRAVGSPPRATPASPGPKGDQPEHLPPSALGLRWRRRRAGDAPGRGPAWRDLGVAARAVALDTVLFTGLSQEAGQVGWAGPQPGWLIVLAGAVSVPVLALRRRAPSARVPGDVAVRSGGHRGAGFEAPDSLLVALYAAAVWCSRVTGPGLPLGVLAAHAVAVGYEASFPASRRATWPWSPSCTACST